MTKITLSRPLKIALIVLSGAFLGAGLLFLYMLRFTTYLGDDPSACVNCHIMQPYYATWDHSSHKNVTTCNECHVPHENVARKYAFKGVDGMKHTAAFLSFSEPQVPAAKDPSAQVIMNNCIRCHQNLVTSMANVGKMDFKMTEDGEGKACWDCHRDVPHGGKNSLSATVNAKVPFPDSPVPDWLQKAIGHHSPHGHLHGK
ncbi:MAG: cytochrome c nitrite reductase small subunit [Bacteroidales bacterium]|nr:cytochrome c nitrite reductase small subunit [Bacteroidales bacterium]